MRTASQRGGCVAPAAWPDGRRWFTAACLAVACALTKGTPASAETLPIRGVVRVVNQAALSTDLPMRIKRLPFREGQRFAAGDVLVEFDCRRQAGEFEAARGAVEEARLNLASNESLDRYKAVGRLDVEIARAKLTKARGDLSALQARMEDCIVRAPFGGRIADAPVRVGEFTTAQRSYLGIIEDGRFEIELIVSSEMLARLKIGQSMRFRLDELPSAILKASVTLLGAVVDPISKTAKIVATVETSIVELAAGMSGTATFDAPAR